MQNIKNIGSRDSKQTIQPLVEKHKDKYVGWSKKYMNTNFSTVIFW